MTTTELHRLLKMRLGRPLPGAEAQQRMAPSSRNPQQISHDNAPRASAVSILLYQKDDEWYFPLIKRNKYEGKHSAQISLPGGKYEAIDVDLRATALRETYEEIGVQLNTDQVLGALSPLHIPISNFDVHPFVLLTNEVLHFTPDHNEVQFIIEYPLSKLGDKKNKGLRTINSQGQDIEAPIYYSENDYIWGATAMILSEFAELIRPKT